MESQGFSKPAGLRASELRVLVLLGLAFGFAYFDRMALTFLAPFVHANLKTSNEHVGWANSCLLLTWALAARSPSERPLSPVPSRLRASKSVGLLARRSERSMCPRGCRMR